MATQKLIQERKTTIASILSKDPEIPTATLAKRLMKKHGHLFTSLESARSCVRYHRGETGSTNRKHAGITNPARKRRVSTPIGNIVPSSDLPPEKVKPVELKLKGHGSIFNDIHMPYHSVSALEGALEHSYKIGATDYVILNGDIMDFYQGSKFSINPNTRDLDSELDMVRKFLSDLTKYYKRVIYKLGNHERRWETYLFTTAPAIANMKCLSYEAIFKASELDIEVIRPQQIMHVGKYLNILHAHEFGGGCYNPVNPARGAFMRSQSSCIVAHHHQTSEHTSSDIRGAMTSNWSVGCLSELNPPFLPINKWNHGHATLHVEKNDFEVSNHRILASGKVR